jgi:hypothetical protein
MRTSGRRSGISGVIAFAVCVVSSVTSDYAVAEVSYEGQSLVIGTERFLPNQANDGDYEQGKVLAVVREDKAEEFKSDLVRLGLSSKHQGTQLVLFLIAVPIGFESQWVLALRKLPSVSAADLNKRFSRAK